MGCTLCTDPVHIPAQYLGRLPEAVRSWQCRPAMEENVEFRRAALGDFMDYMGAQHSDSK